jgi:hypothetical protein
MAINDYDFRLTPPERASNLWMRLRSQLELRLESSRKKLENPQEEASTAVLRGEIKCLRTILAFGADPPPMLDEGGELVTVQQHPAFQNLRR